MTKTTTLLISASAIAVIAFAGYRVGKARSAAEGAQVQPSTGAGCLRDGDGEPAAGLESAISRLERRLAVLEARVALAPPQAAASAPTPAPAAPAPTAKGLDPQKEEEQREERAAATEAALRSEQRDRAWASPTEGNLRAAVDAVVNEGGKLAVKDLRCLTSLCELVLSAATTDDLKYLSDQLAPRISGMSSLELSPPVTGADGRATVTCRLFRQGYPRPDEGVL